MTGYARSIISTNEYGTFVIELHTVNSKYRDLIFNMPRQILELESKIRGIIQAHITRGRINLFISQPKGTTIANLSIDTRLAKQYIGNLRKIKKDLNLGGSVDIDSIYGLKELVVYKDQDINIGKIWPKLEKALKNTIKNLNKMRGKEGGTIKKHIELPIKNITKVLNEIDKKIPQLIDHFRKNLISKIKEAGVNINHADERIIKEVAILAEHMDITEEINRMKSHISQFRSLLNKNEAVGRTLDFLLQEMIRETNTMGSKTVRTEIPTKVVYIKSQLDKIREQVQNVE